MRFWRCFLFLLAVLALGACGGDEDNGFPVCRFTNPALLAGESPWPKFRRDPQNTGTAAVPAVAETGGVRWVFPPLPAAKGAFSASPVLNPSGAVLYIGSSDGTMYALNATDGTERSTFTFSSTLPITSTALVAVRNGQDAIFFGGGDSRLHALNGTGAVQGDFWPFFSSGFLAASPALSRSDGTVYGGSIGGSFFGVCPNGVARFTLSLPPTQSSPAVGADNTVYFGGDDRQLRAIRYDGVAKWAFSASAPILTAPVIEERNNATVAIYIADSGGQVFKVNASGGRFSEAGPGGQRITFDFVGENGGPVGPILSSPALAVSVKRLYFGSSDARVYAVDSVTGRIVWTFQTGAEVLSSPAVATDVRGLDPVIVIGSNDGNVYFLRDEGLQARVLTTVSIGAPVRSSPAIGADGTVYTGADDGRVYAIGGS